MKKTNTNKPETKKPESTFKSLMQEYGKNPKDKNAKALYPLSFAIVYNSLAKYTRVGGCTEKRYNETNTSINRIYSLIGELYHAKALLQVEINFDDIASIAYSKRGKIKNVFTPDEKSACKRLAEDSFGDAMDMVQACAEKLNEMFNRFGKEREFFDIEKPVLVKRLKKRIFKYGQKPAESDYITEKLSPVQITYRYVSSIVRGENKTVCDNRYSYIEHIDKYGNTWYERTLFNINDDAEITDIIEILNNLDITETEKLYCRLLYNNFKPVDIARYFSSRLDLTCKRIERLQKKLASQLHITLEKAPCRNAKALYLFVNNECKAVYHSISECAKALHIAKSQISKCLSDDYYIESLLCNGEIYTFKIAEKPESKPESKPEMPESYTKARIFTPSPESIKPVHADYTSDFETILASRFNADYNEFFKRARISKISANINCKKW